MQLRLHVSLLVLFTGASLSAQPPMPPPGAGPGDIAATVNGETITVAQLDAALNSDLPDAPLSIGQRRQLRVALLNDLIDETLIRQFLAKNGPRVDPAEVDAQMTALKARLVKENRSLAEYLKQTGRTEPQLREEWTTQIRLANYVKLQATAEKLKAYHAANRDHFDKVEVRVSHIVIRVGRNASAVDRAIAKEKLQKIRNDLLSNTLTFVAAAKKFSQCPSASKGGDLGFIPRRGLPEEEPLAKAAFALRVGALSEVVETEYGVHLLTITERRPGTPSVLEKCGVEVLEAYTEDFRLELLSKLRKEAQIRISSP